MGDRWKLALGGAAILGAAIAATLLFFSHFGNRPAVLTATVLEKNADPSKQQPIAGVNITLQNPAATAAPPPEPNRTLPDFSPSPCLRKSSAVRPSR